LTRAVVITGASTGIGYATACALARMGMRVYAGVRNARDAERLGAHDGIVPLTIDVTDAPSLAAAAARVRDDGAALVGLVCNAGIAIGGPLESVPIDEWRRQFEINTIGAVATVQAFAPLLRRAPSRIVLVGSISGRIAFPYLAPYAASKFALRAIADALRVELAPAKIGVYLIEPGSVKTPIWEKGRAMNDALRARVTPEMPAYYHDAVDALVRGLDGEEQGGIPVEMVAERIARTLTARRAPARQIVGAAARGAAMIGTLPVAIRDRIVRRVMRVP
jgi:NAD(P)-dependent dehydrogenase (short-subunit alcohol dehydrogenase family)